MEQQDIQMIANLAQIVAFAVAAVWAVTLWYQQVFPLLSANVDAHATSQTSWSQSSGCCVINFKVSVENRGLRNVHIAPVRYKVTRRSAPHLAPGTSFTPVSGAAEVVEEGELEALQGILKPREIWYESRLYLVDPLQPSYYALTATVTTSDGHGLQEVSASSLGCEREEQQRGA